ncbi:potassium channel GORK-like [Salvia miltiorrhiza]|uniref:potassium channel GORK-like n=1 Tax=Salvia miltiorrhiza TaxID=226208 RepID=UPI0025ABE1BD|nr:potassium channel GORK-like [Salvia miltiorrhiza]
MKENLRASAQFKQSLKLNGPYFLVEAIKKGHGGAASLLEEAGAAAHVESPGICLCEAVARNELDFVARLLANGMNPNSKNYNLQTPLHVAAAEGLFEVSVLLLQNGGSVFARDRWGRTPLEEARVGGDHKLVQLLEDAKRRHQMSDFSG